MTFWFQGKGCESLVRTYEKLLSVNTWKESWFFTQLCFNHGWLSCLFFRLCRSNYDIIVAQDYLKLVEGMHIFHLNPTLLNLEVCSSTSKHLKLSTQSVKTVRADWFAYFQGLIGVILTSFTWNHLNFVEGMHTFRLSPNLLILEVSSFTFMHLKLPTRSAKTVKNRGQVDQTTCHSPSLL